jgi:acyl dehydratase
VTFAVPIDDRHFEDYVPGTVHRLGTVEVAERDVIEFARRFDPQPFHVDAEAAKRSTFGGLIASGWHTGALTMSVLVRDYISSVASLGSPGMDEIRWLKPVRPGDVLSVQVTILEATRSRSKPDRGVVRSQIETMNQRGEVVMRAQALGLFRLRGAGG